MSSVRYPSEAPEGIVDQTINGSPVSGVLSITEIEVLDLISEGEIEGLVEGYYTFETQKLQDGTLGNIGWNSYSFTPYGSPDENPFLNSIYWNEVPLISNVSNKYNFQSIDVGFTNGLPNGATIGQQTPTLTVSRTIGERLRFTEIDTSDISGTPINNNNHSKVYKIFNKECKGAVINIKVGQLGSTVLKNGKNDETNQAEYFGDVVVTEILYNIYSRPLYANPGHNSSFILSKKNDANRSPAKESIKGKVTYGYIRSTHILLESPADDDFIGWEVKIIRLTPDSITSNLRNQTIIDSITEVYSDVFTYPNSAIIRQKFNAEFFAQIPNRAFDCKLLKVKVPNNYDPIGKTYGRSDAENVPTVKEERGNDFWNGVFKENKEWTDNPAWCFYDLISNPRYGLGKYIPENFIDKWTLYEIAKYCDTLVADGMGGLEPRFTCNLVINSRDEAYKVINDFASVFRALTYYGGGSIFAVQDSPKIPILQFTNANVENGDFNYQSSSKRTRHTVAVVRYNDKTDFYKPAIEYVEDIEGIRKYGIRELDLSAFGCTSRGQAIRFGRWALLSETTETETISFIAGIEGAYLRPGDVFQTYDSNRKTKRMGGRTTYIDIDEVNNQITFTLDSEIILPPDPDPLIEEKPHYNFCLLTPSFNYDVTLNNDLSSSDTQSIRKVFIQSGLFTSDQVIPTSDEFGNYSKIYFPISSPSFNVTDYSFTGNPVWTIGMTGEITTLNQTNSFVDKNFDYYRTLKISEKDDYKYEVVGLQYNETKFVQIESGLSFTISKPTLHQGPPPAPNTIISLILTKPTQGFQFIDYSFIVSDPTSITSYLVYAKNEAFDSGIPSDSYLVDSLPLYINNGRITPNENGTWYVRVYAVIGSAGADPSIYGESSIDILNTSSTQNVIISSLQFNNIITGNASAYKSSGIYTTLSPSFAWQVGFSNNNPLPLDLSYRITFRQPSSNNTPSNIIYFEATGLNFSTGNFVYTFPFDTNRGLVQGPYREYDIIVEGMNASGDTSAGNTLNPLSETWSNTNGYDIFYANNPRPSGITLNSGSFNSGPYKTRNWLDAHGSVYVKFETGVVDTDLIGGFLYASTGVFTKNQVISGNPNIITGEFEYNYFTKTIFCPVNLIGMNTGYIGLSFYDNFDYERKQNGVDIKYGVSGSGWVMDISNIVPVEASGEYENLDIKNKLVIKNINAFGDKQAISVKRTMENGSEFVEIFGNNGLNSGVRFASYLP